MGNRLEELLLQNPKLLGKITKTATPEETLAIVKKHIDYYSLAELHNDLVMLKNDKHIADDESELNLEQLENVAGGVKINGSISPHELSAGINGWLTNESGLSQKFLK